MGRRAKTYPTKSKKVYIRETYLQAITELLKKENLFNPTKPAHGDFSTLVQQQLEAWLKRKLSPKDFGMLQRLKKAEQVKDLDFVAKGDQA